MIRINLLPHREAARRLRRLRFRALAASMLIAGGLIALAAHSFNANRIERQQSDNAFLKSEIAKLDKDIAEIRRLREQTQALLARKQVIELLQSHRAETVYVFNELARAMPEGAYLKSLKQKDLTLNLAGYAQSNARVSTLMRNLDSSPVLASPQLVEIKAGDINKRRVAEFNLNISVKRTAPVDEKTALGPAVRIAGGGKS